MKYNKLIRDRIPEIIEGKGEIPITCVLSDDEFKEKLEEKLLEEVNEFLEKADDVSELADILEVVYALAEVLGISKEELERIRAEKQQKRGGFKKKLLLQKVK